MFTGLIQVIGTIEHVARRGDEAEIRVATAFGPLALGESIAVAGACLTVTDRPAGGFTAFASAETLARSTLGRLAPGARVNLERALRVGDPLGGHLVTGHVDAAVTVLARERTGGAERFTISLPPRPLDRQIAEKGSVAVDGVSLTVNEIRGEGFAVVIIPLTLRATTLGWTKPGDAVNIETDVIAKYVAGRLGAGDGGGVDIDLLTRTGFAR